MILHLVRHGQTPYNLNQWGLGRADVPLTPPGEQQAAEQRDEQGESAGD